MEDFNTVLDEFELKLKQLNRLSFLQKASALIKTENPILIAGGLGLLDAVIHDIELDIYLDSETVGTA